MIRFFGRRKAQPPRLDTRTFDLMCITMAVVLALHAPHLSWWFVVALASILAIRWWQRRHRPAIVPAWLKVPLLVLVSVSIVFQYGNLFGRAPGTALAVALLVLKLLETETARDARIGTGFACFALMAALLFDQGLVATFVVALGLLPAFATLRALEPTQTSTSLPRQLVPGITLLAAALPLALFAFLLVPRLSTPLWGAPSPDNVASTGLSDQMSPSDFTQLLTDDSPAMRVTFDDAPPPRNLRYFRAYVMWDYDGHDWSRGNRIGVAPASIESNDSIGYHVSLEATRERILPALDVPLDAPAQAHLHADREMLAEKPVTTRLEYSLHSALHFRLQAVLDNESRLRALQLPKDFDPRTHALATQWRQRYGNDDGAIVHAALALFHDGGFSYTLLPAPLGRDAIDDFLFQTHEGFCEHYSSAFTVLMRAAGIPARVVTGYQGGFWNSLGNYLLVRNADAHAWSEVWLSGHGWVRVDPTAAVRPERVNLGAAAAAGDQLPWYQNDWLQSGRNRWDIVNRWWNQGVIGFDALRQSTLLTPFGVHDIDTTTMGLLLTVGGVVFAALGLIWAMRRKTNEDPARRIMRTLEQKLARVGVVRRLSEGPQHYLRRAIRTLPSQRAELDTMMRCYIEVRYAHNEPPPESMRTFRQAVRSFRPRRVVK